MASKLLPSPVSAKEVDYTTHILLVSSAQDEEGYAVPRSSASLSGFLTTLLESSDPNDELKIPVNDFHPQAVRAIAAWMTHFGTSPEAPKAGAIPRPCDVTGALYPRSVLTPYEERYVDALLPRLGSDKLRMHVTLLNAANFLNLRDLLLLLGCALAMRFKGKQLGEIKALMEHQLPLRVSDDFQGWPQGE
jgi:hypothetical protein